MAFYGPGSLASLVTHTMDAPTGISTSVGGELSSRDQLQSYTAQQAQVQTEISGAQSKANMINIVAATTAASVPSSRLELKTLPREEHSDQLQPSAAH